MTIYQIDSIAAGQSNLSNVASQANADNPATKDQATPLDNQTIPASNQIQRTNLTDSVDISNEAAGTNQDANKTSISKKAPIAAMSHVVEEYNNKGELRIKFEDSKNNVIYQIPSAMVAKMEDLMTKAKSTTTKS
jgi:hypothetical protein